MKNRMLTRILLAGSAAVLVAGATATLAHDGWGGHGWKHKAHWGGAQGAMREQAMNLYETLDANGDGDLALTEVETVLATKHQGADANTDGALTIDEFETLWLEQMRPLMVRHFQRLDRNGDAAVTEAEMQRPFQRIAERLDRNEDGIVERRELRRLRGMHRGHDDRLHDDDDSREP